MELGATAFDDLAVRTDAQRSWTRKVAALLRKILEFLGLLSGPSIDGFSPSSGYPGTLVTLTGAGFSDVRERNDVVIGGERALVVSSSSNEIRAITADDVTTGPVQVTVDGLSGSGPVPFSVLGYPNAGAGEDGPPISFGGAGQGGQGDVNPIGTVRVLVALVTPNDRTPGAGERATVVNAWNNVTTFYNQASYGRTNVQVDVMTDWAELDGSEADFLNDSNDNIDWGQIDRLTAQAAQAAVNEGFDLDDYAMMACVCSLGVFIRAWGGWSRQNFSYINIGVFPPIIINLSADHQINLIAISQDADWGRCAHEFGHNVVSAPSFTGDGTATLGEDVYGSDLVDSSAATAAAFEMMGSHDTHPLFSGYHMEKLGYYDPANIQTLNWDRNPFSGEFDIAAHALSEDNSAALHLLKIKIAQGLHYYVQVRQQPGPTAQIFDDSIPLAGAANQGGAIVTSVVSDTLNTNQQTRFITLLHDNRVLTTGDVVEDPARGLRITIVDAAVQARPLVCRVRVEWAQTIADDPNGAFDLYVEPWGPNWQTPDIWVDRAPFGTFDQPLDPEGRPQGNGDKPRPMEINLLKGRIHVSGAAGATNVKATFYAVDPPGVGDNGNWAPVGMQTIASIAPNSFADVERNWVPVVGKHTCLKLWASPQLGEVSGGNNFAQENVFDFESPASSPPQPVIIDAAVRNPLEERCCVRIGVKGVPFGWRVHYPHAWVWLDAKAEKHFPLTVIPMFDASAYGTGDEKRRAMRTARVNLEGSLPRKYDTPLAPSDLPAGSRAYPIGGILGSVTVKKRVTLRIAEDRKGDRDRESGEARRIPIHGRIKPAIGGQRVLVRCTDPAGDDRIQEARTDASGEFRVSFDLSIAPTLEADREAWRPAERFVAGVYRVRAAVVAAAEAAETSSNLLHIQRG